MAKNDYHYAEMLNLMREQGRKDNPTTLQLGIMRSPNSVQIGDLLLYAEDLYISDNCVNLQAGNVVAVEKLHDTNKYIILSKVVQL